MERFIDDKEVTVNNGLTSSTKSYLQGLKEFDKFVRNYIKEKNKKLPKKKCYIQGKEINLDKLS